MAVGLGVIDWLAMVVNMRKRPKVPVDEKSLNVVYDISH